MLVLRVCVVTRVVRGSHHSVVGPHLQYCMLHAAFKHQTGIKDLILIEYLMLQLCLMLQYYAAYM